MERSLDGVSGLVFLTSAWDCIFSDLGSLANDWFDLLKLVLLEDAVLGGVPTTDFGVIVNFVDGDLGVLTGAGLDGVLGGDFDLFVTDEAEDVLGDTLFGVFLVTDVLWSLEVVIELLPWATFGTDLFDDALDETLPAWFSEGDLGLFTEQQDFGVFEYTDDWDMCDADANRSADGLFSLIGVFGKTVSTDETVLYSADFGLDSTSVELVVFNSNGTDTFGDLIGADSVVAVGLEFILIGEAEVDWWSRIDFDALAAGIKSISVLVATGCWSVFSISSCFIFRDVV